MKKVDALRSQDRDALRVRRPNSEGARIGTECVG